MAFVADEVCNCLELFDCGVEVEIKGEDGKPKKVMSYQLVCDVCGNEVGIKRDGKYYLSDVIEENAAIWSVCWTLLFTRNLFIFLICFAYFGYNESTSCCTNCNALPADLSRETAIRKSERGQDRRYL